MVNAPTITYYSAMTLKRIPFTSFSTLAVLTALLVVRAAEPEALFGPWKHQDIGAVEVKGGASFNAGVYTIKGTLDTWGTNDGFHFVWQPFHGDGQIVARVVSV